MPGLNLTQISNKLNLEFNYDERKLVFWYDEKSEFRNDIEDIHLEKAKLLIVNYTPL